VRIPQIEGSLLGDGQVVPDGGCHQGPRRFRSPAPG
jgi:hypothetical protein